MNTVIKRESAHFGNSAYSYVKYGLLAFQIRVFVGVEKRHRR